MLNHILHAIFEWAWSAEHFSDRRIQACSVVIWCFMVIAWGMYYHSNDTTTTLAASIVNAAWLTLAGTVGIYHFARGVDSFQERRLSHDNEPSR